MADGVGRGRGLGAGSSTGTSWSSIAKGLASTSLSGSSAPSTESIPSSVASAPPSLPSARSAAPPPQAAPVSGPVAVSNYLELNKQTNFRIHGYRVDFIPEEDNTRRKKSLMTAHRATLGSFFMDGHTLYSGFEIPEENLQLESKWKDTTYQISLRKVSEVQPSEITVDQFYNVALRSLLSQMGYEQIGRNYYKRAEMIDLPQYRLQLWPGVITAIRNHAGGRMMCVELTHKVLRTETAWDIILGLSERKVSKDEMQKALQHSIVMTHYNRRTYRIDGIRFDITPRDSFMKDSDGNNVTYAQYVKDRYDITIPADELDQPMLESIPRRKDINKESRDSIFLVSSLCYMTGLTDDQRKNFTLMRDLSKYLHLDPNERKKKMDLFLVSLQQPKVVQELRNWNIEISKQYLRVPFKVMPSETVTMKNRSAEEVIKPDAADWTKHFSRCSVMEPKVLKNWVIYYPHRDNKAHIVDLIKMLREGGERLGMRITADPVHKCYDAGRKFEEVQFMQEMRRIEGLELIFYVLPNNQLPRYAAVKAACSLKLNCLSQCFQSKHMTKQSNILRSVVQKVLIQMNAKLGGVPWKIKIPAPKLMILGFDMYHCPDPRREGQTVGALVGTTNSDCTKYYSVTKFHKTPNELAANLRESVKECLTAYRNCNNGGLPGQLVLFRDGVGEGQVDFVSTYEVNEVVAGVQEIYKKVTGQSVVDVHLAFVIVTKKINSRFVSETPDKTRWLNPVPGTVVDTHITLPGREEFFLVSQTVRQGTVSPTNYNVIKNDTKILDKKRIEQLSFKLCHLYYNWSGTVAVPAPCQYAHKLAFLTGMALADNVSPQLSNKLWYL